MLQTGSYLPMNYFLKEKLKDRLQYCMEWQKNAETYLFHKSITAEVDKNFYNNKAQIITVRQIKKYYQKFNINI